MENNEKIVIEWKWTFCLMRELKQRPRSGRNRHLYPNEVRRVVVNNSLIFRWCEKIATTISTGTRLHQSVNPILSLISISIDWGLTPQPTATPQLLCGHDPKPSQPRLNGPSTASWSNQKTANWQKHRFLQNQLVKSHKTRWTSNSTRRHVLKPSPITLQLHPLKEIQVIS